MLHIGPVWGETPIGSHIWDQMFILMSFWHIVLKWLCSSSQLQRSFCMKKNCPSYWRLNLIVAIILSLSLELWSLIKSDNFPTPLVPDFCGLCWCLCGLSPPTDQGTLRAKIWKIGRFLLFLPEGWCICCLFLHIFSKLSSHLYLCLEFFNLLF